MSNNDHQTEAPDLNLSECEEEKSSLIGIYSSKLPKKLGDYFENGVTHPEKALKCKMCEVAFFFQKQLDQHIEEIHGIVKIGKAIQCNECKKVLKDEDLYRNHKKYTHGSNKNFVCDICEIGYSAKHLMIRHMKRNHNEKGQYCPFCEKVYPPPYGVTEHLQRVHKLPKLVLVRPKTNCRGGFLICHICTLVSSSSKKLFLHYKEKHKRTKRKPYTFGEKSTECDKCNKVFKTSTMLHVHKKQVHEVSTVDSYCEECDMQFKNAYLLKAHKRQSLKHVGKKFKCYLCSDRFRTKNFLEQHVQFFHENKRDVCPICDIECPPPHGLSSHLRRKHDLPNLKNASKGGTCHICGYTSETSEGFYLHFKEIHGGINPIRCGECDRVFLSRWSFNNHKQGRHKETKHKEEGTKDGIGSDSIKVEMVDSEDKSLKEFGSYSKGSKNPLSTKATRSNMFICDTCHIEYKTRNGILGHLKYSSAHAVKNFKCQFCSKKFLSDGHLKRHISFAHEGIGGYLCPLCGKKCFRAADLSTHLGYHRKKLNQNKNVEDVKAVDSQNDPKMCEECGKVFKNNERYKTHFRLMHSKEQAAYCEECGKEYRSLKQLKQHLKYSANHAVKALECPQCNIKFVSRPLLDGHVQYIHENKGYPCPICQKVFPPPYGLTKHMKQVHYNPKQKLK